MRSLYRRNNGSGTRGLAIATALVVLVLGIDALAGGAVRRVVRDTSISVWRFGAERVGGVFHGGFFSTRGALLEENAALRSEIAHLSEKAAAASALEEEVSHLRGLVRLAESSPGITAPVISSLSSSPYGTFSIGAGTADGVEAGSLVLGGSDAGTAFVLGRVSEAGERTALVMEVLAPHAEVEARLGSARMIVEGRGDGNGRAEIPEALSVEIGDPVTAPSLGGRVIGVVGAVVGDVASASQKIYVRLPINPGELRFVYVVPSDL